MSKLTINRYLKYFFRGLLIIVPLALTIYIIIVCIQWLDNLIPMRFPGVGLLIILFTITFFGYLGSTLMVRPIFDFLERLIIRLPLANIIYTSLKDLMSAFVGDKKKFNTPIVVKMSENLYRLGFMTQEDMAALDQPGLAAVYFPHSYNFSGNSYLVPRENVRVLKNVNSAEVMKFIVSGGVSDLTVLEKLH